MKVRVYSASTCPYGDALRGYLKTKGVRFNEVFVDLDPEGAQDLALKTNVVGVPFMRITKGDKEFAIMGFNKRRINYILDLH